MEPFAEFPQARMEFPFFYGKAGKADMAAMDGLVLARANYARGLENGGTAETEETTIMTRCEAQWLEMRLLVGGCATFAELSEEERGLIVRAVMRTPDI